LKRWQSTPGAEWDSLGAKDRDAIRKALVRDLGALCAYCQRRIVPNRSAMRIEHWSACNPRRGETTARGNDHLRWRNLLGVCDGGSRLSGKEPLTHHCDVHRGNAPLYLQPAEGEGPSPRDHLRYRGNGKVEADDARAAADIEALNLNARPLERGRTAVLDGLRSGIGSAPSRLSYLQSTLATLDGLKPGDQWPTHVEVVRYQLRRWLRRRP
jgi:uncharacterized protein (TIGR02646 family)